MDQVTEDRQWAGVGVLERERDGIANAEAHAEVGRSKDTHTVPDFDPLCHIPDTGARGARSDGMHGCRIAVRAAESSAPDEDRVRCL